MGPVPSGLPVELRRRLVQTGLGTGQAPLILGHRGLQRLGQRVHGPRVLHLVDGDRRGVGGLPVDDRIVVVRRATRPVRRHGASLPRLGQFARRPHTAAGHTAHGEQHQHATRRHGRQPLRTPANRLRLGFGHHAHAVRGRHLVLFAHPRSFPIIGPTAGTPFRERGTVRMNTSYATAGDPAARHAIHPTIRRYRGSGRGSRTGGAPLQYTQATATRSHRRTAYAGSRPCRRREESSGPTDGLAITFGFRIPSHGESFPQQIQHGIDLAACMRIDRTDLSMRRGLGGRLI